MVDLILIFCLWMSDITVYTIFLIKYDFNPSNFDDTSIDCIIDTALFTIGILVQLVLRLYLRCVKKIKQSDGELISIKILIVHIIMYFFSYLFLFEKWIAMDEVNMSLQYIVKEFSHPRLCLVNISNHIGHNCIWVCGKLNIHIC